MSSTNPQTRGGGETDFFPTPDWVTESILPELGELKGKTILEPCAGDGAMVEVLIKHGADPHLITAVEIQGCMGPRLSKLGVRTIVGDFLAMTPADIAGAHGFDVVLQNAPFILAQEFVEHADKVLLSTGTMACLGRLAFFLCGQERRAFRKAYPFDFFQLDARPSFSGEWIRRLERSGVDMASILEPLRRENKKKMRIETIAETRSRFMGSDSADYAWAVYGPGRGGRFRELETSKPRGAPRRKKATS